MTRVAGKADGLTARQQLAVFPAAFLIIFLRRPDALLRAQFYAEDGREWFAEAYNRGWWRVLFDSYQGYLHLFPRLVGGFAQLVPVAYAPLIFNVLAIAIQTLPACILMSPRSRGWGPLRFRAFLAFLYLVLPNTGEIMATVTESQWPLALAAFLLVVGSPPQTRAGRVFDIVVLTACCFTGPFCMLLLPIAVYLQAKRGGRQLAGAITALGSVTQAIYLLAHLTSRHHSPLGASLEWFVRILSTQVFIATFIGGNLLATRISLPVHVLIVILGCGLLYAAAKKGTTEIRLFLIFSVLLFGISLARPVVTTAPPGITEWNLLAFAADCHYMFLMTVATAWSAAICLRSKSAALQIFASCLLFLLFTVGMVREFRYRPFDDLQYPEYAKKLELAQAGTEVTIPENPAGWSFTLRKH